MEEPQDYDAVCGVSSLSTLIQNIFILLSRPSVFLIFLFSYCNITTHVSSIYITINLSLYSMHGQMTGIVALALQLLAFPTTTP